VGKDLRPVADQQMVGARPGAVDAADPGVRLARIARISGDLKRHYQRPSYALECRVVGAGFVIAEEIR